MKKFGTVALSLALAASLTVPAFAADGLLISPAPAGDAGVMPISAPLTSWCSMGASWTAPPSPPP